MILKPREPRTRLQHIKEAFWPSMGVVRVVKYYKHRVSRLPGTPDYIASGFATGVAISFTPFVGFHLVIAGVITWMIGGSLVAMVLGTLAAGNPWTYPFIWLSTYKLGQEMRGAHISRTASKALDHQFTFSDLLHNPTDLLLPMSLGCLPLAIAAWIASFYLVSGIVKRSKAARMRRIHRKRRAESR